MNDRKFQFFLLFPAILITLGLILAINGVRGSDQFWYLADTETLVMGAPAETNARFPGMILRQNNGDPQTNFLHNGPTLLLNATLGRLIGAFNAWKASNLAILLLSALLTALTVTHLSNRIWGIATFSLFVVSPIAVWQAANLLREPFFGLLIAILMYLFVCHDTDNTKGQARWLIIPVLFTGMMSHPLFTVLAFLFALYSAFLLKNLTLFATTALLIALTVIVKDDWFPSSFQPGITTIIASAVPGKTNMLWQLSDTVEPITFGLLADKLVFALEMQFVNLRYAPMYLLTNVGIFSFIVLLITRRQQFGKFLIFAFLIISAYVGIAILMQNQPRYQMISAPVTVASVIVLLSTFKPKKSLKYTLAAVIVLFLFIDVFLLQKARLDIQAHNQEISSLRETFEKIGPDARIAIVGTSVGRYIRYTYALAPRKVLTIDTDVLGPEKITKAIQLFKPSYLIFESDSLLNAKSTDSEPIFLLSQSGSKPKLPVYQFDEKLLDFMPPSGDMSHE